MSQHKALFLDFDIQAQPDEVTCGPTCLHALYNYYGDDISLKEVIREVKNLKTGGTLAVMMGNHALQRGYRAHIYTYNLHIFDPSWFQHPSSKMVNFLQKQMKYKSSSKKLRVASKAYIQFLKAGGDIVFAEMNQELIKSYLTRSIPILAGLSATYLYNTARETPSNTYDSIRGEPVGHFTVINGFDDRDGDVYLADPMHPNPLKSQYYSVNFDRLINSIMLGVLTYDANVLIIEKKGKTRASEK
jgi:hypothetical protein